MRHPYQVSIVANGSEIVIARRGKLSAALAQVDTLRSAIGTFRKPAELPVVKLIDLRELSGDGSEPAVNDAEPVDID